MERRSRRSAAKVKTGCKTCKFRRVKCDEQRPNCLKCTSTGRQCDGYASLKQGFEVHIWNPGQGPAFQKTVSLLPGLDDSVRYLEFYHRCARPVLSGNFDNSFWSRTTLQMAFSEPAVRHALIALGYLHSTESGSLKHARSRFTAITESKTFLHHYNMSVKSLVDRMGQSNYKTEVGLVTCLLFVCMEFLRGNHQTAFTHLINGLNIITEREKKVRHDSVNSPLSSCSVDTSTTLTTFNISTLIEDELKPIFIRALTSAMLYGAVLDIRPYVTDLDLRHFEDLRFSNIREMELSAYEVRNHSILQSRYLGLKRHFYQVKVFTAKELGQKQLVLDCQQAWYAATEHYRNTHALTKSDELVIQALLIGHYITYIWLLCQLDPTAMAIDAYLDEFQTVLLYCERILDSMDLDTPQHAARFTFEISLIPALYSVALRCRCPVTRRKAVALLQRNPPREGLWDVATHLLVAKRVIEMEEVEVDERGWPVERTRLWNVGVNADMDRKGGFWAYFTPNEELKKTVEEGRPLSKAEFLHV
ncbi:hypothetical protein HBH56_109360 [Parastagonospora nodorum]|uniref:Zn(2)-C6 fungal-type domain-containing protein n=1 Tax=Phaeosphaeria nodorum (strain SN15 / ATCC MYA-4574 / FGSC 10173) TaxID=321614 RepID=A0A7U2FHQ4_PHANO|nr:hypothetical protein HBH56_109360 [Parastagonospora nodorum]QRD03265.1 hypothetical protein JI435_100390 [Parastagonospora nodorum SN15]KAH3922344.1 hypothetical protein HBH54_226460 [Parastagonospora nodorum]KAH3974283.1 hypothetical protein HBH51_093180 [Parastagonospora nodorum]KAH4035060.1 hypothetical protein HBI09_094760 [Parastagonospora nodorum]